MISEKPNSNYRRIKTMANIEIKHLLEFDLNDNELNDLINESVGNAIERRNQ